MPRSDREERRADRARIAKQWGACLSDAIAESGLTRLQIVERAAALGATFNISNLSHWASGDNVANGENVLLLAATLQRDPVPMLRAAGHHVFADQIVKLVEEALHGERLLRQEKQGNDRPAM